MNIKELKDILQGILQSDILEFELEHTGTKIRLRRGLVVETHNVHSTPPPPALSVSAPPARAESNAPVPVISASAGNEEDEGLHVITSPIVGTFYRSSSPGTEPFAKVGDIVEEGKTLCIVEAMKLMNEIPSDVTGEVIRIYVENGHPVEFGHPLFGIRPTR